MIKQPPRNHFDYGWPGDARILDIQPEDDALGRTFDRFDISLDDPLNVSGKDLHIGRCNCRFLNPKETELRLWKDDKRYRPGEDLSKLVNCTLEDSGDMSTDNGHYFELTGFLESDWFEFRVVCDEYELEISKEDDLLVNQRPNKANTADAKNRAAD